MLQRKKVPDDTYIFNSQIFLHCLDLSCTWNILECIRTTCKFNTDTQNGDHMLQQKKVPDDTYSFNS